MTWDLWGPSYPPVELGTTYSPECEWHCDFYFGYGHDVIEENALNEKLCLEVVRRLLAKADTEFDELEKDLVSLQSELGRFKHEEWPHVHCGALGEKTAFHHASVKNLRKDEISIEAQSPKYMEPANSKDEIMEDKYVLEKDEQPANKIIDSTSESWRLANYKNTSSESISESSRQLEAKEQGPEEKETSKMTSNNEQPANTITTNSNSDSLGLAAGFSDKKFMSSKTYLESSIQCEPKGQGPMPEEKQTSCMINNNQPAQTSSCDSGGTRQWETKGQGFLSEEKEMIPDASPHYERNSLQEVECMTTKCSTSVSSIVEKTSPEISDSKLINEAAGQSLIPKADSICISLRLDGHGPDSKMVEIEQPADIISNDTLIHGNGCDMKHLSMHILTEDEHDEIKEHPSTSTARSQTLKSSLSPDIKATVQETKKPASSLVKYGGQDALRQSAGIKKSNECLESGLCALSPTKSKCCDGEQKLIKFIPKTAREVFRESKMTLGNKSGYPNKSLKTAGNGRNQQTDKFESWITDEEDSDQFTIAKETQKDENGGLASQPLLTSGLNSPRPKRKRKSQLTAQNVHETCCPSTEISLNTTFISNAEKEQLSKVADDYTRLNFLSSKQCEKAGHLEQYEDKQQGTCVGNSKTSASQSQKKRKIQPAADTEAMTACIGTEGLDGDVQKKRKATETLTRAAGVKKKSLCLGMQDSDRDTTNGSTEEELKHLEKEDPKTVEALKSQNQSKMTSTSAFPTEIRDLSSQDLQKDRDATTGLNKEDSLIKKSNCGDDPQARNSVPYTILTLIPSLSKMTLGQLKDVAKSIELKGYSKLRKRDLVERLERQASSQGGH